MYHLHLNEFFSPQNWPYLYILNYWFQGNLQEYFFFRIYFNHKNWKKVKILNNKLEKNYTHFKIEFKKILHKISSSDSRFEFSEKNWIRNFFLPVVVFFFKFFKVHPWIHISSLNFLIQRASDSDCMHFFYGNI